MALAVCQAPQLKAPNIKLSTTTQGSPSSISPQFTIKKLAFPMTILPSSEGASMGGDHHSSEEADLSMFAAVLSSIHLERLPDFASEIRSRNRHPQDKILPGKNGCSVVSPPLYGSYHILFTINLTMVKNGY